MVIEQGLNVRQAEALKTNSAPRDRTAKAAVARDPETEAIERDLADRLGLKVDISFDGKGGTVRLGYRTLEQLDTIIALLSRG